MKTVPISPLTAPTPATPSPWYFVEPVTVINPDGVGTAWAIGVEGKDGEFLSTDEDESFPWFAKTKACALSHVRYLNGITAEFPTCTCHD